MKTSVKITLVAGSLLTLAGMATGIYLFFLTHDDLSKVNPDFTLSAIELQKEFETDEAAAVKKFVNKVIEVSGIATSVSTGEGNTYNISLKTASAFSTVICTFNNGTLAGNISPGDQVTVRGECSGYLMDVLLNYCVIVR